MTEEAAQEAPTDESPMEQAYKAFLEKSNSSASQRTHDAFEAGWNAAMEASPSGESEVPPDLDRK